MTKKKRLEILSECMQHKYFNTGFEEIKKPRVAEQAIPCETASSPSKDGSSRGGSVLCQGTIEHELSFALGELF